MKFELIKPNTVNASIEEYSITHATGDHYNNILNSYWWITITNKNHFNSKRFLTWQEAIAWFDQLYKCSSDWKVTK